MRRPAKTLPAIPKVLPLRATAALPLLTGAAPVEDALPDADVVAEPVFEGAPAVVLVERVEDAELSVVVAAAPVPVGEEVSVLVVLVELPLSEEDAVPPDLVISKV